MVQRRRRQRFMKMATPFLLHLPLVLSFAFLALAANNSPLKDFCVADTTSQVQANGFPCKDTKLVTSDDFFFSGLNKAGNTSNSYGSSITPVSVTQLPGLNTLGLTIARVDYAPGGAIPLHTHPRAAELLIVQEGSLSVGFVTSFPDNQLFRKVLYPGDVFLIPQGLIHYQRNPGNVSTVTISALPSQNPGIVIIPGGVFGSKPAIPDDVLIKTFFVGGDAIDALKAPYLG